MLVYQIIRKQKYLVGLDLEIFLGIVVEYNGSFDQGSNDRKAFSLYGWKGEAHRQLLIWYIC